MQQAQIHEPFKPLVLVKSEIPAPPADGLVIKTSYSGVCHSDLHQWDDSVGQGSSTEPVHFSDHPLYNFPITPGHEIAGVVHSLGGGTGPDSLKVGDRVVIYPWIGCRDCGYCNNQCYDSCPQVFNCFGFITPGGYANYVVVPQKKFAVPVPDSVPLDVACMLACSGLTSYNAVTTTLPAIEAAIKYKGNARTLIIGAGGLGLWGIQGAAHQYPSNCSITVADIDKEKLKVAKQRGCHHTLLWDRSLSEEEIVNMSTKDGQYDAIIDFVNNTITANRAFKCLSNLGTQVMVGLFGGEAKFSLPGVVFGHKQIVGVLVGSLDMMKDLLKLAEKKSLVPPPIHYVGLEEVTGAMQKLKDGKVEGRYVIEFN